MSKVVLIVPVGRWRTLRLLVPHLLRAKPLFAYCELWMNALWDEDDVFWIRQLVRNNPGTFVLKDDGDWGIVHTFRHYGRYYKTLAYDDTLYIKIDDDIVWMEKDAIQKLIAARLKDPVPIIVIGNTVNNAFCNGQHQKNGVYDKSWQLDAFRAKDNYNGEFSEFAHTKLLGHINRGTTYVYNFDDQSTHRERIPNHVFAFFGRDVKWDLDDEAHIGEALSSEERPILIAGAPLFSHFAYGEQWEHMDKTDLLYKYREVLPHEG